MMKRLSTLLKIWQKKKIEQSDYSEMNKADFALPQETNQSGNIFHLSCKTLTLNPFIQALCNNDYTGLLIEGEFIEAEGINAWNEILFEYSGLIDSQDSAYILELSKEIGLLQYHIIYVDNATLLLRTENIEEIAEELRCMGYIIPEFGSQGYLKALDMVVSTAETKIYELEMLRQEYDRLNKTKGGKKQTEEDYIRTVGMISKYQGYNIDRGTISVFDFVQLFNNYLSEMKINQKVS